MSPSGNPFRSRYTEMQRDRAGFLTTFSTTMLEALPDAAVAWNRLVVLRSAPGAGKTSMLRMLTPDNLAAFRSPTRDDHLEELRSALNSSGVLSDGRPQLLGLMVSVGRDYRSLVDLGPQGAGALKIFFKLLDARILTRAVEAALTATDQRFPDGASSVEFQPNAGPDTERARALAKRLFNIDNAPFNGQQILDQLREKERTVLDLLGSLMPVDWESVDGHPDLLSLEFLATTRIFINGSELHARPVLLFDDVHDLDPDQRTALYNALIVREPRVGRWIAERRSAVPLNELLIGRTEGREYSLIEIEKHLDRPFKQRQIMTAIADSRAMRPLLSQGRNELFSMLLSNTESIPDGLMERALAEAERDASAAVEAHPEHRQWLARLTEQGEAQSVLERAVGFRELRILIERNLNRQAPTLFDFVEELDPDRADKLSSSSTRAAAKLFLAREQNIPYYFGPNVLAELSSRNIEQYLALAGDQFDLILSALMIRGRSPYLLASEQDVRVRRGSKEMWNTIPRRIPNGMDVQALLYSIAERGRAETYQPTAPYAPGVTGMALEWSEAQRLFRAPQQDSNLERLRNAFGQAVANNLLETTAEPQSVKNSRFQVFYLNRMLLPHFSLPLQRGGFREQSVARTLNRWTRAAARLGGHLPDIDDDVSLPDERLL
ncbi:hypothetical protein DEJ16_06910 [Curtobacterium sp. MCJR17_055]|nr:hypothetical protein DEI87_02670 [Curtobacterium sp. MCBD17_029]PYY57058.1 hypothetical protein DEJ16_06910 [Curtobacterium sp. MCJR17_055]PYY62025.1 hypothetical protein DEJ26_00610 [Curtobacterium sp. MCPF17_015]